MTSSLCPDERSGLARRLIAAPARVQRRATAAAAGTRPAGTGAGGEWSAEQVVLHLVAVETDVFQLRLSDLQALDAPEWIWVEPGPAVAAPGESLDDAVRRYAAARLATLEAVAALDEAGWRRSGRHATLGTLDVAGLLALAADHDAEHLATLARMARSARTNVPRG